MRPTQTSSPASIPNSRAMCLFGIQESLADWLPPDWKYKLLATDDRISWYYSIGSCPGIQFRRPTSHDSSRAWLQMCGFYSTADQANKVLVESICTIFVAILPLTEGFPGLVEDYVPGTTLVGSRYPGSSRELVAAGNRFQEKSPLANPSAGFEDGREFAIETIHQANSAALRIHQVANRQDNPFTLFLTVAVMQSATFWTNVATEALTSSSFQNTQSSRNGTLRGGCGGAWNNFGSFAEASKKLRDLAKNGTSGLARSRCGAPTGGNVRDRHMFSNTASLNSTEPHAPSHQALTQSPHCIPSRF